MIIMIRWVILAILVFLLWHGTTASGSGQDYIVLQHTFYDGSGGLGNTPDNVGMTVAGTLPRPAVLRTLRGVEIDTTDDPSTMFGWVGEAPFTLDPEIGFSVTVALALPECTGQASCATLAVIAGDDDDPYPIRLDIRPNNIHVRCDSATVKRLSDNNYQITVIPAAAKQPPCDIDALLEMHPGQVFFGDMTHSGGIKAEFIRLEATANVRVVSRLYLPVVIVELGDLPDRYE